MKKYKFQAKIHAGDGGGAYVVFPFDVQKEFGTKGRVPVKAIFNGTPYRGSLVQLWDCPTYAADAQNDTRADGDDSGR
jgi:hypothetical protein